MAVKAVNRTKEAIEELLAQQRLDGTPGLEVRLSPQNQLYLNTWRPTRAAIPASLLEQTVPGFKTGVPCMLRVTCIEKNTTTYHRYVGGDTWLPTVPKEVGRADEVFHIGVELFGMDDFFSRYPRLMFQNDALLPYMTDQAVVEVHRDRKEVTIAVHQFPPIADAWDFQLNGELSDKLIFQTGSIQATFRVIDALGKERWFRLHHNGHKRAGLAVGMDRTDFRPIFHVSYDGFRASFAYKYSMGISVTSFYLRRPDSLYRIGTLHEISHRIPVRGITKVFRLDRVDIIRDHEKRLVSSGKHYEIGRVGAEIAYTIAREKFGCDDLVIEEPARRGTDIHSRDSRVLVEAKFFSRIQPSLLGPEISRQMERVSHRIRKDFKYNKSAVVGYAILSFVEFGVIKTIIAQMRPDSHRREE